MTGSAAAAILDEAIKARTSAAQATAKAKATLKAVNRLQRTLDRTTGAEVTRLVLDLTDKIHSRDALIRHMAAELYGRRVAMQTVEDSR